MDVVALFTTKAEYMTVTEVAKEAFWLKDFVEQLSFEKERILLQ